MQTSKIRKTPDWIAKSVLFLFIALFSLIFIQVVFFNSSFGYSIFIQSALLAFGFVFICILSLFILHYKSFFFNHRHKLLFCTLLFILLIQVWVSIVTFQAVDHDYGKVYNGAVIFTLEGNSEAFQEYRNYYHHFPNNTGEFLLLQLIFKGMYAVGSQNFYAVTMALGHGMFIIAILFTFLYLDSSYGSAPALISLLFFLAFLPVYFQSSIVYTDTLSIGLVPLLLYCYQKSKFIQKRWKQLALYFTIGLIAAFSLQIKATVFITVIAIAVEAIFRLNWKQTILFFTISGLVLALFSWIFQLYAYTVVLDRQQVENEAMPITFWIMMGLTGDGSYNPTDEWDITCSVPGKKARQELNLRYSKDRLQAMGPIGYLQLLHRKTSRTFGSGNGEVYYLLVRHPHKPNHWIYSFISQDGQFFRYFDNLSHSFYLTFYLFSITGAVLALRQKSLVFFSNFAPFLSLIGFYLFMLIWESNHRQLVNQWPLYIIVAAIGASVIVPTIKNHVALTRPKQWRK